MVEITRKVNSIAELREIKDAFCTLFNEFPQIKLYGQFEEVKTQEIVFGSTGIDLLSFEARNLVLLVDGGKCRCIPNGIVTAKLSCQSASC